MNFELVRSRRSSTTSSWRPSKAGKTTQEALAAIGCRRPAYATTTQPFNTRRAGEQLEPVRRSAGAGSEGADVKTEYKIFVGVAGVPVRRGRSSTAAGRTAQTGHLEWIGTVALILSGLLCSMCGGFFWFVSRRIDLRPEDRDGRRDRRRRRRDRLLQPGQLLAVRHRAGRRDRRPRPGVLDVVADRGSAWSRSIFARRRPALRVLHRHPAHRRALITPVASRPMRAHDGPLPERSGPFALVQVARGGGCQAAWRRVARRRAAAGQPGDRWTTIGAIDLGGAAAGADQLGAVVVAVGAGRHLEQHVAVADDAAQFAFRHGWLLSSAGRWNYPNVIQTLPRNRPACGALATGVSTGSGPMSRLAPSFTAAADLGTAPRPTPGRAYRRPGGALDPAVQRAVAAPESIASAARAMPARSASARSPASRPLGGQRRRRVDQHRVADRAGLAGEQPAGHVGVERRVAAAQVGRVAAGQAQVGRVEQRPPRPCRRGPPRPGSARRW